MLHRSDCRTAVAWFAYCDEMRHGVWSVTKSAMLNMALRTEKYGVGILRGAEFLPQARRPGWSDGRSFDAANSTLEPGRLAGAAADRI